MTGITLDHIHAALALPNFDVDAARQRMTPRPRTTRRPPWKPGGARLAGVLALLFPGGEGDLSIVLMRRADQPHDAHSGQVSFPGGQHENSESLVETALREAQEELGVNPRAVQVLGALANLRTPSDFNIYPTVGYTPTRPAWQPDPAEVARVIEFPLAQLIDDAVKMAEEWNLGGYRLWVPYYRVDGENVWGATAMMLSELEHRLRAVIGA